MGNGPAAPQRLSNKGNILLSDGSSYAILLGGYPGSLKPKWKGTIVEHRPESRCALAQTTSVGRRLLNAFFVLLLLAGMAVADPPAADQSQPAEKKSELAQLTRAITYNPQVNPYLNGWGNLGLMFGLNKETIRLGGLFLPQLNWTATGGAKPHSWFGSLLVGVNAGVDLKRTLGIPGATFGVEFVAYTGGAANLASGTVLKYDGVNTQAPNSRQELTQLWWHQRLFHDKLVFQIGKMNAAGSFGTVALPVPISDPKLADMDITVLVWPMSGINPTMYGRLPIWPNNAYGAVVHFAPTKNFYASYGIFDGNNSQNNHTNIQTGLMLEPKINSNKFHIAEVGATYLLGAEQMPGKFGIGGWVQTGKLFTPNLTYQNGATGYYLFANQRLWYRHPSIDNSGLIGFMQFGRTSDQAAQVNTCLNGGLTAVDLLPALPYNRVSLGVAWGELNDAPIAGIFFYNGFYPGVPSNTTRFNGSELMIQVALQSTLVFPVKGLWVPNEAITFNLAYTYIPTPGQRPNLPQAHTLLLRMVQMF
jgi:porin